MALSEHEQRLLDQMERALSAEDPRLASTLRGSTPTRRRRRTLLLSLSGFVVGLALLLVGALQRQLVALSVVGFVVMLVCVVTGVNGWRTRPPQLRVVDPQPGGRRVTVGGRPGVAEPPRLVARTEQPRRAGQRTPFMQRMEERWQRRRSGRGF